MDATAPRRFSLRARLVLAGFAAAGIPVAILLAVDAVVGMPGMATAIVAGLGAWLSTGSVLALVMRRLTSPLERLVADTAERADATRASLEQQVAARTVELSEARDRAEREARLKGVFLAAMSHEIRTPMNSIVGMAELMAETPLDGEQREYCDTIRTSTDALLGVINDILDFSKFEAQGVSLETLDFDLRLVVEDAVELLAVKASTAGIDLAAVIEPGFDGRFRGDPTRLRQVVVNLLSNAIKFTARGSVVARVTGLASGLASGPDATGVRIEVADTGIGMTPEGLARLFRPFAQAEDSTTRHYGGTGLGLTISKQIVERMDGRIGVTSEPGRGSTFWVEIPFPRGTALAPPARLAQRVADALVVEPLDASADALVRLLTELGVRATRVATAGDGLAALEARPAGFAVAFVSLDAIDAAPFVDALLPHAAAGHTTVAAIVPAGRRGGADLDRLGPVLRLTRPMRRARLVECLDAISPRAGRPRTAPAPLSAAPAVRRHAGPCAARPRRRRLLRQPAAGHPAAREARLHRRGRRRRPGRRGRDARLRLRRRADGLQHAAPRRLRGHRAHPRPRARPPDADPGDDGQRFARGSRRLPARRDGRLPGEADPGGDRARRRRSLVGDRPPAGLADPARRARRSRREAAR